MNSHPDAETRTRYLRGLLPPQEFLEIDDHLAACAACRAEMAPPLSRVANSMHEGIVGQHLQYEQLEAVIDGAGPGEGVDAHLRKCAMCAKELDDLRRASEVSQQPSPQARWYYWAAAAAAILAVFLGAMTLLRKPHVDPADPLPPERARTISKPPVPVASPPALSAPLAQVLDQLAAGILPSAKIVEEFHGGSERTRGAAADAARLRVIGPIGVLQDRQPHFRWTTRRDARYRVEVFDASYGRVVMSGTLSRDDWRPPSALARGVTYSWQVTETRDDGVLTAPVPPDPPARFTIISAAAAAELEASPSHLATALVLAREGVIDRALEEMTLAQNEHPDSHPIQRAIETLRRYQPAPTATNPPQ